MKGLPAMVLLLALTGGARLATAQNLTGELAPLNFRAPEFPVAETPFPSPESPEAPGPPRPGGQPGTSPAQPAASLGSAPALVWINSRPLTMSALRGKVVLVDFWEYTCINCIRTFAENKRWYARYHKYGFEIIGVHDPEFDIAYSPEHVRAAVKRFGLPYPVVVDTGFQLWRSYHNSTWPNRFLIDAKGYARYNRPGEGADSAIEKAIQALLVQAHPELKFSESYTIPPEQDAFAPTCGVPTPEMYVGHWHDRGILANSEGYRDHKTLDYTLPASVDDGHAAVSGRWETDMNGMIYRGKARQGANSGDRLEMRYHARELYAVMNAAHTPASRLYIRQDGKDLTPEDKGVDVQMDSEGHSYIEVREPRMYYLVQNRSFGSHEVDLIPTRSGTTVNSFTFGNNCQTDFPHL